MRKRIGKTAVLVAVYDNGCEPGNFDYCVERLYRSRAGKYYLHGIGGAATRWCRSLPDGWTTGGEDVERLDEADVRRWIVDRDPEILEPDTMRRDGTLVVRVY